MIPEDLERLVNKETYKILVVNGRPPLFENLTKRLKNDGYNAKEYKGPRLWLLPNIRNLKSASKKKSIRIIANMGSVYQRLPEIVDKNPDFILINYKEENKRNFMYATLAPLALNASLEGKVLPVVSISKDDYELLSKGLDVGRAINLFSYKLKNLIERFHSKNCDPTLRIGRKCKEMMGLLYEVMQRDLKEDDMERLEKEIITAYDEVRENELFYSFSEDKRPVLEELGFRLKGVFSIIYNKNLENESNKTEERVEDSREKLDPSKDNINIDDFIKENELNLNPSLLKYLDIKFYGTPLHNDIVMLIQEGDNYRVLYKNIDWVNQTLGSLVLPGIDMISLGETDPIAKGREEEYIKNLKDKGIFVLKVDDHHPEGLDFSQKDTMASLLYAVVKKKYGEKFSN